MSMNRSRTEQNAINYGTSRCLECCFLYHHFKSSLTDSHQLYLRVVDLQFLCVNTVSIADKLVILSHQLMFRSHWGFLTWRSPRGGITKSHVSGPECLVHLCTTWKDRNSENRFAFKTRSAHRKRSNGTTSTSYTPGKHSCRFSL